MLMMALKLCKRERNKNEGKDLSKLGTLIDVTSRKGTFSYVWKISVFCYVLIGYVNLERDYTALNKDKLLASIAFLRRMRVCFSLRVFNGQRGI